ncbi:Ger(x)C family spore germination protein [Neobacillus sp. 19]|uniref:Ger(x)C family spore germination protein n=1 Tax=Neobacillus sp. 19 TaxID=3394458 RepID=UPI003BF626BB
MLKCLKRNLLAALLSCVIFLSGCVERKQLEKLGLMTAVGYDLEQENRIKGTAVVHKFDPLAKNLTKIITVDGNTSKAIRQEQNLETDQRLVMGQLRCVIYSRELAKRGIVQLVDAINRDPSIGNTVYLTVAEGDASSILNIEQKNLKADLGTYLYNLIRQNVESEQLLSPTLHDFNHFFSDHGKDPVLPILKIKNGTIIISGIALFKEDKMVDTLNSDELFYLKVLSDKYQSGSFELGFSRSRFNKVIRKVEDIAYRTVYNKFYLNLDNIRSHSTIKLIDKQNLRYKIEIDLASILLEATEPLDLSTPENIKYIENEANKEMEKEIKKLLLTLQKNEVDPVGFGEKYIASTRGKRISKKGWKRIYKNAKFDVEVKNTIIKTGSID